MPTGAWRDPPDPGLNGNLALKRKTAAKEGAKGEAFLPSPRRQTTPAAGFCKRCRKL